LVIFFKEKAGEIEDGSEVQPIDEPLIEPEAVEAAPFSLKQ